MVAEVAAADGAAAEVNPTPNTLPSAYWCAQAAKPTGIIYPPSEIRNIVDKTATFVARNGPDFEKRILANESSNQQFAFLTVI